MTASRDPDRLIHEFLLEGEEQLQDQVYDAVRAEIEQKRQRAVFGPWRTPTMNKFVTIGLAAAVAVVVAVRRRFSAPRFADGGLARRWSNATTRVDASSHLAVGRRSATSSRTGRRPARRSLLRHPSVEAGWRHRRILESSVTGATLRTWRPPSPCRAGVMAPTSSGRRQRAPPPRDDVVLMTGRRADRSTYEELRRGSRYVVPMLAPGTPVRNAVCGRR